MLNNKWCRVLGILTIVSFVSAATFAEEPQVKQRRSFGLSPAYGGKISSGFPLVTSDGNVAYRVGLGSGTSSLQDPGEKTADDIVLQDMGVHGNGDLIKYSVNVIGFDDTIDVSCPLAGTSYQTTVGLYAATAGGGFPGSAADPDVLIPGTECVFDIPIFNAFVTIECKVAPGISLPDEGFYMLMENTGGGECQGWELAGGSGINEVGSTRDRFEARFLCSDIPDGNDCPFGAGFGGCSPGGICLWTAIGQNEWVGLWFGGCPFCGSFNAEVIVEGQPWACCDPVTFDCANVQETTCESSGGIYSEFTLCNDLPVGGCSASGGCCDTTNGVCTDTFASECTGFLEFFSEGIPCSQLRGVCLVPDNVPTVSQWGMIVLTVLLVAGLSIKFGRRRTATA